jgi:hypothetical protein
VNIGTVGVGEAIVNKLLQAAAQCAFGALRGVQQCGVIAKAGELPSQ